MGFKAKGKRISTFLQNAAQAALGTSMANALNRGIALSATRCDVCDDRPGAPEVVCPLGALVLDHAPKSTTDCEVAAERLLAVPGEWLIDLMRGFDGRSKRAQDYPGAFRVGRKLRQKYLHLSPALEKAAA